MRLIDADALKETIMDMRNHCEPSPCLPHQTFLIPDAVIGRKIDAAPTIDAVPVVHGEWIRGDKLAWQLEHYICSVCSTILWGKRRNYCPNCGAKMDGGKDDETD